MLLVGRQSIADILADQRDILGDIRDTLQKKRPRDEEDVAEMRSLLLDMFGTLVDAGLASPDHVEKMAKLGLAPAEFEPNKAQ